MARPRKTAAKAEVGQIVHYNDGTRDRYALVVDGKNSEGTQTLFLLEGSPVSAPQRDPKDYGPEGGGVTWRPLG